jgi:hypothetical protein
VISHKVWGKNAYWPLGEFFIKLKKKEKGWKNTSGH